MVELKKDKIEKEVELELNLYVNDVGVIDYKGKKFYIALETEAFSNSSLKTIKKYIADFKDGEWEYNAERKELYIETDLENLHEKFVK